MDPTRHPCPEPSLPDRPQDDIGRDLLATKVPMRQRLAAYAEALVKEGSPFVAAYDRLVARLAASAVGAAAPAVGEVMPPFLLPDQCGRLVGLAELLDAGPAVVSFNRGPWCPFCRIELSSHLAAEPGLADLGATLVSIMPEPRARTALLAQELGQKLVVLSDVDNGYALSIGLAMWVGDEVIALMRAEGIDLAATRGDDAWMLPLPATFVLDRDGRVLARRVDPDFRTRMDTDEVLAVLAQDRGA